MNFQQLMAQLPGIPSSALSEKPVQGITFDSREAKPGFLFIALKGTQSDGHTHIQTALENGAEYCLVERIVEVPEQLKGRQLRVKDTLEMMAALAVRYYENPSQKMLVFGVTGTNGKTSITYMLEHLLNYGGFPTAVIGTIDQHFFEKSWPTKNTTPDSLTLQKRIREFRDAGAQALAMEVSSHGLELGRIEGVQFNVAIFTNLTQDHLDFHKTMENYFSAKQRLFNQVLAKSQKRPVFAIVNRDDKWGRRLRIAEQAGLWTYGKTSQSDFYYQILSANFGETEFQLRSPFGVVKAKVPLIGEHNIANVVASVAASAVVGVLPKEGLSMMARFSGVPGRLQRVPSRNGKFVYVDYAHSPDSLEKTLHTLRGLKSAGDSRLHVVFGCGGDRDQKKRPLMGRIAAELADVVILTSDNPRSEDPDQILKEIFAGVEGSSQKKVSLEPDREKAILQGIDGMSFGDVLVIAGKGHETTQTIKAETREFSDFKVAERILA